MNIVTAYSEFFWSGKFVYVPIRTLLMQCVITNVTRKREGKTDVHLIIKYSQNICIILYALELPEKQLYDGF